jgi:iron complex transport system substrate-binding protein
LKSKQIVMIIFVACLLPGLLAACKPQFQPGSYTDDMGRQVDIEEVPERIVSFGPSVTEILFALGLGDKVVGVDMYSDYPEEAAAKPYVGDAWNPSIESIVALEPDLVVTVESEQLTGELEALGFTYIILDPGDFYSIANDFRLAGEVTGKRAEGEQLAANMEEAIDEVTERVQGAGRPKVFFIVDATDPNKPWTSGSLSFIHDIITIAGGENIAGWVSDDFVEINIEEIVDAEPDIIVVQTWGGGIPTITAEELQEHIIWQQLEAVKEGRIYFINGDLISRFGPRIVQGLEEIARIIHPELYD